MLFMSKKQAMKMLRTEEEIVSLDAGSHAMFAALGLEMRLAGKTVKAKLVARPWQNNGSFWDAENTPEHKRKMAEALEACTGAVKTTYGVEKA